jgi:hypothetical protein
LFSCSEEEVPKTNVYEIRQIGILATTEFTLGKVLKLTDDKEWYKFGDRKILISTKAKVKAGVNLMAIKEGDIETIGNTIKIKLPAVEITSFEMNPGDIQTEMIDINGFRMGFTQAEKNEILRLGEQSIRKEVYATNILQEAQKNTTSFIKDFYGQMGYEEIIIEYRSNK